MSDKNTIYSKEWRMQNLYLIRTEGAKLTKMKFTPIQKRMFDRAEKKNRRGLRYWILKARKEGVTTFWAIYYLDESLWNMNTRSAIQAHKRTASQDIFEIVRLAYRTCPDQVKLEDGKIWQKPKANYDSVNELRFTSMNSAIVVTLDARGSTINNLHLSEVAWYKDAKNQVLGTLESVPNIEFGSNVTGESTANGVGDYYEETWQDTQTGAGIFEGVFFGWYEKPSNVMTAPDNWSPSKTTIEMIEKLKKHDPDVDLTQNQKFWWEKKKETLKRIMEQEHPTIPDDAFLSSDMQIFDGVKLRGLKTSEPIADRKGWQILEEPKEGRQYVVGGDPAEGVGGDHTAGSVIDTITLKEVAYYYDKNTKPHTFAEKLAYIGKHYNNAIIAPERNNHGHAVIQSLKKQYSNIFMEVKTDEKRNKKTKRLGWHTNARTRDLILDKFVEYFDDDTFNPNSAILKNEMTTFITNESGKREAKAGKHDDLIMATAIALFVASMPKRSFNVYSIN